MPFLNEEDGGESQGFRHIPFGESEDRSMFNDSNRSRIVSSATSPGTSSAGQP